MFHTKQETIFPASLLTAFSTNHLTNVDKTKHNYKEDWFVE